MKTTIIKLLTFICLCLSANIYAQDIIILKDDTKIKCTIEEVSEEYVKYKPWASSVDRTIVLDRNLIRKIKYEGGDPDVMDKKTIEENYFMDDTRNAIKLGFTGVLADGLTLAYERAIDPRSSYEIIARYQGLGFASDGFYPKGFGLGAAYRFNLASSERKAAKNAHILTGMYFKPEVYYMYSSIPVFTGTTNRSDYNVSNGGVYLSWGKEWVLNNVFVLEGFIGFGFAINLGDNVEDLYPNCPDCEPPLNVAISGGETFNLSGTRAAWGWGIRLGYAFNTAKDKAKQKTKSK